jgi:hypothetical protein
MNADETQWVMTGELFLGHSVNKLTEMSGYVEACVSRLDGEQVWKGPQNSVGNLVLHLCGNVRQWIGSSIGGLVDIRQREREFAASSRMGAEELLSLLNSTVGEAVTILRNLAPERLTERVSTQDGHRYVLEVIYQVVGHFQQHAGQIIYATKMMTGEDLKFYKKSS